MDVFSEMKEPFTAAMQGENVGEMVINYVSKAFESFLSEELLTKAILELHANQTESGHQIFNEEDTEDEQTKSKLFFMWRQVEPGTIASLRKIYEGATGQHGRELAPELIALFGPRITRFDPQQRFGQKIFKEQQRRAEAAKIFGKLLNSKDQVSTATLMDTYKRMEGQRRGIFDGMHEDAKAALRMQVPLPTWLKTMNESRVSKEDAELITFGVYKPWTPSGQVRKWLERRVAEGDVSAVNRLLFVDLLRAMNP